MRGAIAVGRLLALITKPAPRRAATSRGRRAAEPTSKFVRASGGESLRPCIAGLVADTSSAPIAGAWPDFSLRSSVSTIDSFLETGLKEAQLLVLLVQIPPVLLIRKNPLKRDAIPIPNANP